MAENIDKEVMERAHKRIEAGEIARTVALEELAKQGESKEVVLSRVEAYARCGAIIDNDDLRKVCEQYDFSFEDYRILVHAFQEGMTEGVIQEPNNVRRLGIRGENFAYVAQKGIEKDNRGSKPEEKNVLFEVEYVPTNGDGKKTYKATVSLFASNIEEARQILGTKDGKYLLPLGAQIRDVKIKK